MRKNYIRIIDIDKNELDVELISIFEEYNNKYLIYTKGEKQKSGNLIIYINKLVIKEGKYYIENIIDDEEWGSVKKLLSNTISK